MKCLRLYTDFESIIAYKTRFRDVQLGKESINEQYVAFLSREINFLQSMYELLKLNDAKSELESVKQRANSFNSGKTFGILVERFKVSGMKWDNDRFSIIQSAQP